MNCPTCGSPVHTFTGREGTSHYESATASLLLQRDDRIMDLAAKLDEAEEKLRREQVARTALREVVGQRDERIAKLEAACPVCGHEWSRHDPQDGRCDAGMPDAIDLPEWEREQAEQYLPCPCGRDLTYHSFRARDLARAALAATEKQA